MRLLRFLSTTLGALKRVPGLPQVLEGLLLVASLLFNRPLLRALDAVERTMRTWPGVSVHPHRFGGTQFDLDGREIGHVHGNGIVDVPLDRATAGAAIRAGQAVPHHTCPGTGWISRPIRSEAEVPAVLALLEVSCKRRRAGDGYNRGMKTVASVDIGTNSVKMTVAETEKGSGAPLRVLIDLTKVTRLGKGVDASGRLDDESVRRTLDALAEFAALAREKNAAGIAGVGTSALRDAANGAEFVAEAERALGGTVEIISGDREAHLIYQAARRDPDLALPQTGTLGVMDIGGGSTEIVLGSGEAVTYRNSLQLGAVRLTERALRGDPPAGGEVEKAIEIADHALAAVPAPSDPESAQTTLVGSGGTIANLAAMELGLLEFTPDALQGMRLTLDQIEARLYYLAERTVAERRGIPGLEPARADVILAGAIIQARALRRLGVGEVIVNLRSLRYGLLYELADAD